MATGDFIFNNDGTGYGTQMWTTSSAIQTNDRYFTIDYANGEFVAHKDREWDNEENSL